MAGRVQTADPKEKVGEVGGFVETAFTEKEVDAAAKLEIERNDDEAAEKACDFLGTLPGVGK